MKKKVLVVGAGLAGSDCAYFLAQNDIEVVLCESKTKRPTPAQKLKTYGELVCTNSLKSMNPNSGHGLLKYEMESFNSLVLSSAMESKVPAGDALAVDREKFSGLITEKLKSHQNIVVIDEEVVNPLEAKENYGCDYVVLATGPLTTSQLEDWIIKEISQDDLYFYDAIAPVVDADSLDLEKMYFKDRHKDIDESGDYLNIALNEQQYYEFVQDLVDAEKVPAQNFEQFKYFESCLPIDVMAERGKDTLRFSCMKPIGLEQKDGKRPFAVIQLRKENLLGDAYNMVGFQTKLKYPEQLKVFRKLPGFSKAEFLHLGSVHRNTFIHSKKLLNFDMSCKKYPFLYFAGQITGVEGYTESAGMGLYVGFQILRKIQEKDGLRFPVDTAIGALVNYIMTVEKPTPSNINFGLLPPISLTKEERKEKDRKKLKKIKKVTRAKKSFDSFLGRVQ